MTAIALQIRSDCKNACETAGREVAIPAPYVTIYMEKDGGYHMKKILLLCLVFLRLGSFTACSKAGNTATADGQEQNLEESDFSKLVKDDNILKVSSKDTDITVKLGSVPKDLVVSGELLDASGKPLYHHVVKISFQEKDGNIVFQNEALLLSAVSSDSDILKKSLLAYRIHSESESMDWHLLVQLQDV